MDKDMKRAIMDLMDKLGTIDYIQPESIPSIELYMDQVTSFIDGQLAGSKRHEDDKLLTKTMINNYTKNDLLPPPVKKKYSKEHLLSLIFIINNTSNIPSTTPSVSIITSPILYLLLLPISI